MSVEAIPSKPNGDSLARVFPRSTPFASICLQLIGLTSCLPLLWLVRAIIIVWGGHSSENRFEKAAIVLSYS